MKVYLGGPINGCTDEEANGWRDAVKPEIEARGHSWIDPMDRDYRGREMEPGIAQKIVDGDKSDIADADVLLMNCPKPSVGTSMEIMLGYIQGQDGPAPKTIVAVIPDDGREPSPWLVVHSDHIYRGAALDAVKELL